MERFLSSLASLVAVATVWRFLFSPAVGPVNMILSAILDTDIANLPAWTNATGPVMFLVIFFSVWKNMATTWSSTLRDFRG